jgi:RIO kinase 1
VKDYQEDSDTLESFGGHKDRKKPKGRTRVGELYVKKEKVRSSVHTFEEPSLQNLFELGFITDLVGELKSGKEATVYLARGPQGLLAAKIYRDREVRSFKNDLVYKHQREVPKSHRKKIHEQASRLEISKEQAYWIYFEYTQLWQLYEAGISVPKPAIGPGINDIARAGRVVLMEFIGDETLSAPRLSDAKLNKDDAEQAWQQSVENLVKIVQLGKVHSDYSTYNLLWWQGNVYVIDVPQMVELEKNRHAQELLERDVNSLCVSFHRHDIYKDPAELLLEVKARV